MALKLALISAAAGAVLVLSGAALPSSRIEVPVVCDTVDAAQKAELHLLPLPAGKKVAFSCRWDDSHDRNFVMRELMMKYGIKATFYLHDTKRKSFWRKVFPALHSDGFTIGNHTMSHRDLSLFTPNGMFFDILWWRIMLENMSNQSVTAFVVPYSRVESPYIPGVPALTGSVLRRAGMLGGADFAPDMYRLFGCEKGEYSGTRMLVPGARNTSLLKFEQQLQDHLKAVPEHLHVSMGIHALHTGKDMQTLENIMKKYSGLQDWWYCNENEYIAYSTMFHQSRILGKRVVGRTAYFTLELPRRELLGSDIALWGKCSGRIFPIPDRRKTPQIIGVAADNGSSLEFSGLKVLLVRSGDHLKLNISNSGAPLKDVLLTLRLAPVFEQEQIFVELKQIDREYSAEWQLKRKRGVDPSGIELCAVQIDFSRNGQQGRLWSCHTEKVPAGTVGYRVYFNKAEISIADAEKLSADSAVIPGNFNIAGHDDFLRKGVFRLLIPGRKSAKSGFTAVMEFDGKGKFELKGTLPEQAALNGRKIIIEKGRVSFVSVSERNRLVLPYRKHKSSRREVVLILTPVKDRQ